MPFLRCFRPDFPAPKIRNQHKISTSKRSRRLSTFAVVAALAAVPCIAQGEPQSPQDPNPQAGSAPQSHAAIKIAPITIPAGTTIPLVLTQPVQSRYVRRGDDIYAQVTDPVDAGNEVAIPAGTFVQGTVDRIDHSGGRAELHLQSMALTFPDGYVAPIAGPITLQTGDGYALKDPGPNRFGAALGLVGGGAGIGALVGHSQGSSSSTITSTLPQGCTGPPPGCLTSSVTGPGRKGFDTAVGLTVGGAAGGIAAVALLASSRHFFVDVGTPFAMTLRQPVTLEGGEVAEAVRESAEHPAPPLPVAPRPLPPVPPDTSSPSPATSPGTPATVIPGIPGPSGVPGPPIIIPGTPPGA